MDEFDTPRKHGFERPLDALQFVALFAYVLFMAAFGILHAPLLTTSVWSYIVTGLLAAWIPVSIISYIVAATVPVHDPIIDQAPMAPSDLARAAISNGQYKCHPCAQIMPSTSKHCWACGKCVAGFDHHCRWLNHCVGDRNYFHFAVFLSNTLCLLALQCSLGWYLCVETARDFDAFHSRAVRAFSVETTGGSIALAVFMWIIAVLQLLVVLVLGQLFTLHVELSIRGITTYDLILIKRRASAERKYEREDLGLEVAPTPTCHSLMVWQRRRELGITDGSGHTQAGEPTKNGVEMGSASIRYQTPAEAHSPTLPPIDNDAYDDGHHYNNGRRAFPTGGARASFGDHLDDSEEDDEPSLNTTPRSGRSSGRSSHGAGDQSPQVRRPASFRRSHVASGGGGGPSAEQMEIYDHQQRAQFEYANGSGAAVDDEDDFANDGGLMGASCGSIGSSARRRHDEHTGSGNGPGASSMQRRSVSSRHHFSDLGGANAVDSVQLSTAVSPLQRGASAPRLPHSASGTVSPDDGNGSHGDLPATALVASSGAHHSPSVARVGGYPSAPSPGESDSREWKRADTDDVA